MKKILPLSRFISIVITLLFLSACSSSSESPTLSIIDPQSSPVSVVKELIRLRAANDRSGFNSLVIEGREFLWDEIDGCDGRHPDFSYVEGEMTYFGEVYKIVEIFDHQSENGGFAVKEINGKWFITDWLGAVRCTERTTDIISMMPSGFSSFKESKDSSSSTSLLVFFGLIILVALAVFFAQKTNSQVPNNITNNSTNAPGSTVLLTNYQNESPIINSQQFSDKAIFQRKSISTPRYCGYCGEKWEEGDEFCGSCGHHL